MTCITALLAALLACPVASDEAVNGISDTAVSSSTPAADASVRMRRLHLVRPDLLTLPLAYDVYC